MNRKKIIALIMVIALALTTLVGGTLAYFTDEDNATNTFAMGSVDILLDEAPVDYEPETYTWVADFEADRVKANTYGDEEGLLYPGAVLPKDPTIHNVGLNDAYVRLKLTINADFLDCVMCGDGETEYLELFLEMADVDVYNWLYETDYVEDGVWTLVARYDEILKPGEDTTALFTQLVIPTELEEVGNFAGQDIDMDLLAEAIQAASFADADEAWAAFDGVEELPER